MTSYDREDGDVLVTKPWRSMCPGHQWRSGGSFATVGGVIRYRRICGCELCGAQWFREDPRGRIA